MFLVAWQEQKTSDTSQTFSVCKYMPFHKMIGTMFNGDAGFKFEEIEADSRHYRVDVLQCPYMKYCELLGCKELTSTFCLSDDRVYGNMCGITFERHGTIGRGSDKCDFYFYMN